MFNPLVDDIKNLTDNEVDEKINDLSKKYFQTTNANVRAQIANIYEMYLLEAQSRRAKAYQRENNDNNDLDGLINVS